MNGYDQNIHTSQISLNTEHASCTNVKYQTDWKITYEVWLPIFYQYICKNATECTTTTATEDFHYCIYCWWTDVGNLSASKVQSVSYLSILLGLFNDILQIVLVVEHNMILKKMVTAYFEDKYLFWMTKGNHGKPQPG